MPFIKPDTAPSPFHILSASGLAKAGKTFLGCSGPPGVRIQSLDFGTDGVVQKFPDSDIQVAEYSVNIDLAADELLREKTYARGPEKEALGIKAEDAADVQAKKITREVWMPFCKDFGDALEDPAVRTIVWDRADEVNEMLRLANFGRLERNPQLNYGLVNAEYKQLVRRANQAKKNLVLIHAMAPEFKTVVDSHNNEKSIETGNLKRLGNNKADFLVHSFIELSRVDPVRDPKGNVTRPGRWVTKILRARLNPEVDGMTLDTPDWIGLMSLLAPNVPGEMWL